jgi:CHAT domain-containing protein
MTEEEATQVAKLYGNEPLLQERATEGAVRSQIEHARVVHFATHGYVNPVRAMNSGILLTTPKERPASNDTSHDGVLEAWEVIGQLQLRADVVALSACETARGELVPGEGVIGLARAFQAAGARAVVATQWQVADASTGRLMVAFHQGLRRKLPKDLALQEAVTNLLDDIATAHPYYWAAFRLIGDRAQIPIPTP